MKRAFTLIELLVVIAIIAILAAILFPVFAQAKAAAKKTSAVSNQKQMATAIQIYIGDYDDTWPRNDGCVLNSSLNPAHNNAAPGSDPNLKCQYNFSTGQGSFAFRMNHFSWPKWVFPYTKNAQLSFHPGRGVSDVLGAGTFANSHEWSDWGEICASFALNTAITGALNTGDGGAYGVATATQRIYRNSWLGGSATSLPDPAGAGLLLETTSTTTAIMPQGILNANYTDATVTVYPAVWRETFINDVYGKTGAGCDGTPGSGEPVKLYQGGMVIGYADSHAKFLKAGAIASQTPKATELVPGWTAATSQCTIAGSTQRLGPSGNTVINTNLNYPLWGMTAN
ncbi:MAG: prepilin-type N-terminal cleavage/methylation domain-containing protein [Armatimonadota bacterium]